MIARFGWVSMLVVGGTALASLLVSLWFVPSDAWESFVPLATIVGGLGVLAAAAAAAWVGHGQLRPLRRLVQAVEADQIGRDSLRQIAADAPPEVAALLHALHLTHARLRRTLAQLEHDRAQMDTLFRHMADGVLVIGAEERIEVGNPAAARLLGAPVLIGRPLVEVARDADLVEVARAADGLPVAQVVELRPSLAPRRWVQVVATPLPDSRRKLVVLQDVTDLRRAEAARRDFVANVSHELRTPVAALKALVETLEAGALEDPVHGPDFLRRMHVEVDGLAHLVSELLELARLEAGKLELEPVPCRPGELLLEAVERMRPYAERLGLAVSVAVDLPEEALVQADPRRIGQVLTNLLANAAKFTPPGGRIEAGALQLPREVEFWVADTGVGLHADQLARIFERFYKTDPSRAGSGTGLGLAICKHLVQVHGGRIWAESPGEGQGATFRFSLPRAQPDATGC